MRLDLQALPNDIPLLHKIIRDLVDTFTSKIDSLEAQVSKLKERQKLAQDKQYGKKSEKIQNTALEERLGDLEEFAKEEVESSEQPITKGQPKRHKLPQHLPRTEVVHTLDVCPFCKGEELKKISDDTGEILEYIKGRFKVIKNIRPRCVCSHCEKIVQAYPVSGPIEKSYAGPGLLAHIIAQKFCYHLPLYRQVQMYVNEGMELSRSTLASWMFQCGKVLMPLIQELVDYVLSSPYLHGDDTPVRVLEPGLKKTKTGRIWTYVVDGRNRGDHKAPAVFYRYSPDRKGERPQEHLDEYKGVLHADAYSGYNGVYAKGVTEAGCWAHTRRKFYEVTVVSDQAKIAYNALKAIQQIYKLESEIRGQPPTIRLEHRQKYSKEIVVEMYNDFERNLEALPQKGGTALAIKYALNNKEALMRFLEDGSIEIDNNIAERALRGIAVGRKNWLFAGSDRGGHTAAAFFSLIESAKLNGLDPEEYLHKVLLVIQDYNSQKISELLPWNIKMNG